MLTLKNRKVLSYTLFCYVDQLAFFISVSTVFKRACINTCGWGWGSFLMVINSGFDSRDKRQCWRLWNKMASRHTLFCLVDQLDCYIGGSTVSKRACINTYRWGCGCFEMVINGGFHSNDERLILACCSRANSKLLLDHIILTVDLRLVTGTLINGCFCQRH